MDGKRVDEFTLPEWVAPGCWCSASSDESWLPEEWLLASASWGLLAADLFVFYGQSQIAKIALIIASFLAIFMHGIGQEVSIVPLQKSIMASSGVSMRRLQVGQEIGVLLGNVMTAILFPAVRQFMPALALMFPMAHFLHRSSHASGVQESSTPVKKKSELNSFV